MWPHAPGGTIGARMYISWDSTSTAVSFANWIRHPRSHGCHVHVLQHHHGCFVVHLRVDEVARFDLLTVVYVSQEEPHASKEP